MKLKVTVNGIAYDIDVEVEEQERPTLGAVVIGGGAAAPAPTTASVRATSANAVVAPLSGAVARILVTLLHALEHRQTQRGVACLCIGGGEATAVAIERL